MTLRPLNTERNHHHHLITSPKQQQHSPRDGAPLLRSPRVKTGSSPSSTTTKMSRGGLQRSLSFKNWEAAAPAPARGINGARPGTLALTQPPASPAQRAVLEYFSPRPRAELDEAATRVQRVFKGHRTRRSLADCAIVVEELWWKAYDSASLSIKSISFFDGDKQETAASRWSRAGKRIAKVGKGLCKDDKAQKLALQHWLEAVRNTTESLDHISSCLFSSPFYHQSTYSYVLYYYKCRLTPVTATATTCICITTSGPPVRAPNPSSTGN
jgi:hypothetical protein